MGEDRLSLDELGDMFVGSAGDCMSKSATLTCPYTGQEAYCSGNHRYSGECIGKMGLPGEECKYFKLEGKK